MGNRDLTASFKSELVADINYPFFLFEGVFGATTVRYNSLDRDIDWNSVTWLGNGYLKDIPQVQETKAVETAGLTIELVGEPSVIISVILNNADHSSTCKFYFGFLDSSGNVISDPKLLFEGTLSTAPIIDNVSEATIALNYENELINVLNNNEFRYNQETQQLFYATDIGFEYMESVVQWDGYWGKKNKRKRKKKKDKGKD